jgi:hypothetical protein
MCPLATASRRSSRKLSITLRDMSKAFFGDVADALRGFLPREFRSFDHAIGSRNCKVWFASWHEHYEVQMVPAGVLRASGFTGMSSALEIGFHAEHPRPQHNDEALALVRAKKRALGKDSVPGPFLGRREIADRWRRMSELWEGTFSDDGAAIEAAERMAAYINALEPVLRRGEHAPCACWSAPAREPQPRTGA